MKKRFEMVEKQYVDGGVIRIMKDRVTGVNYLISTLGIGCGVTPLLDENGQVVKNKI